MLNKTIYIKRQSIIYKMGKVIYIKWASNIYLKITPHRHKENVCQLTDVLKSYIVCGLQLQSTNNYINILSLGFCITKTQAQMSWA